DEDLQAFEQEGTLLPRTVSDQALQDFQRRIPKTVDPQDARGDDLSWAGGDFDPDAMHGRQIGADYVGGDQRSKGCRPGDARSDMGPGNQWTTIYGEPGEGPKPESVAPAQVSDAGRLVDSSGQPLNGEFGYVVDLEDGTFYTFDRKEAWINMSGEWK